MEKREFINRIHELISRDLEIDGVEILYKSKEYFCAEYVSAHFNPLSYRIYINEDWLIRVDVIEIIRVVAHEMRHAYQKIQVDFPDLVSKKHDKNEVETWEKEFAQYINPASDVYVYNQQAIEKDAVLYSENLINEAFK
jgi:hypothetical protein